MDSAQAFAELIQTVALLAQANAQLARENDAIRAALARLQRETRPTPQKTRSNQNTGP